MKEVNKLKEGCKEERDSDNKTIKNEQKIKEYTETWTKKRKWY